MDLQQLRYFIAVATHGSISAGAEALGVTQPTISQALHGLEREVRARLFVRVGRGMVLTSAGYALLGPARRILRASGGARESLRARGSGLVGRLDMSVSLGAMTGIVPRLTAAFLSAYRGVRLNMRELPSDSAIPSVLQERIADVVFTQLPINADLSAEEGGSRLVSLDVGEMEVFYAEPPSAHDTAVNDGEDDESEEGVPWEGRGSARRILARPADYGNSLLSGPVSAQRRASLPPVIAAKRETRLAFVAGGVGSTYIAESMAETARVHGVRVRPLSPQIVHRIALVYDETYLSPVAEAFVASVRDHAATSCKNAACAGVGEPSR